MNTQLLKDRSSAARRSLSEPSPSSNQPNMEANSDNSQPRGRAGLASPSFIGLLLTQFLGTLNDNMFRWFVVPLGKEMMESSLALSLGLVCFTLPYALLAAPAGYLADRFSKRTVIVACKVAEVVLVVLGSVAVMLGSIHLLFVVVALMGAQAALFAPSKYGSIAEILRTEKLTKGNGLMGLVTIVSSALGFVAGNGLYVQMQKTVRGDRPDLDGSSRTGGSRPRGDGLYQRRAARAGREFDDPPAADRRPSPPLPEEHGEEHVCRAETLGP